MRQIVTASLCQDGPPYGYISKGWASTSSRNRTEDNKVKQMRLPSIAIHAVSGLAPFPKSHERVGERS